MNTINPLVTILAAIVSSTGVWGFLQFIMGRRNEAARMEAQKEKDKQQKEKDEVDRSTLLAAAQQTAQRTALESAHHAYEQVSGRCDKCMVELRLERHERAKDRARLDALLDAVVEIVPLLPADSESTVSLRAAIRTARQARYEYDP